jgi:hypothetical protein
VHAKADWSFSSGVSKGDLAAKSCLDLATNPEKFLLSTAQIGITLISILTVCLFRLINLNLLCRFSVFFTADYAEGNTPNCCSNSYNFFIHHIW